MIGHCGGLRPSQTIGDYVLAHAYLRDDHVLDDVLPPEIPIPAIAEVQTRLFDAAIDGHRRGRGQLKRRLRTGTVVTTDDRNWELRYTCRRCASTRAGRSAIDMESATVAAQGYRFRVPYGTLLCVSDKPLHGEIKLPGQANAFYERAISQHLRIGIETLHAAEARGRRACTAASCAASTSRRCASRRRGFGSGLGRHLALGRSRPTQSHRGRDPGVERVRALRKAGKTVAARSQEVVDRHPIAAGRIDRLAVRASSPRRCPAGRDRSIA